LKILHLSYSDYIGGAARAAYRIHNGLRSIGLDSEILVARKNSDDDTVITKKSKLSQEISKIRPHLVSPILKLQQTTNVIEHSLNILPSGLHKQINALDIDIVNLHWVHKELISVGEISKINKPIVWTLHDMWPFSGSEHYDDLTQPERYVTGYFKNNRPTSYKGFDVDRFVWLYKLRKWKNQSFTIVCPSRWLADCCQKSVLFQHLATHVIPNPIDLLRFKPIERSIAKEILNLPIDKHLILFGAISAVSDIRKGFHLLKNTIRLLSRKVPKHSVELVVFGSNKPKPPPDLDLKTHYMGHFNDEISLALLYAAADVFISPSMQDNLPNTIVESLASGTPCAAFNIGGMSDLIDHLENGYLAQPFSEEDLASGIAWLLENKQRRYSLSRAARVKAENQYDMTRVANRYKALYETLFTRAASLP
jgi:glycosyltransferase involved in cell wall biosynthesis